MEDSLLGKLHTNQRLLLQEFLRRGIEVEVIIPELEIVEVRYGEHFELIIDRDSSICPYPGSIACANKYLTKKLLQRSGLQVPKGEQFYPDQKEDALKYAQSLSFPLVVKPSFGSHGHGCFTDLESLDQVSDTIDSLVGMFGEERTFLIEQQMAGMEYRIFATAAGKYAVLHRDPASVVGDGTSTIRELAEKESYRRMNPRDTCLCPILLDSNVEDFLALSGQKLSSVPENGKKIYLRRNSNVAQGGCCIDYTSEAHPEVIDVAKRALRSIHGLPYAGIDLLSADISAPLERQHYTILEINSNPGIHMHMRPGIGQAKDVASYMTDLIFPETCGG